MPYRTPSPEMISGASPASGATSSLVAIPGYREVNLATHGIHLRSMDETLPRHVKRLVSDMFKRRQSLEPDMKDTEGRRTLTDLTERNSAESQVAKELKRLIFQNSETEERVKGLCQTVEGYLMRKEHLPTSSQPDFDNRLSQPKPDILYSYVFEAFTLNQQKQLNKMAQSEFTANNQRSIYPFFVVEFKGNAGLTTGSLWVGTNQCLGATAACIKMVEKLNKYVEGLDTSTLQPVDTTVFSIAMSGSEARLFVSWKEGDGQYITQQIEGLAVCRPDHYVRLHRFVRNVIDWGTGSRLAQIGAVLDYIQEEPQKRLHDAIADASDNAIKPDRKRRK
ncbi:hypothetical protein AYL99_11139 [Fonsecaea erecta]|uniref:DUF7924 domain-containing protein n=1 Tax=Fonsecaea erecta TaxID=1367422 RepID=A0A178Z598_9EURO|nr:hypothetical protein AYL99_11139 [Fonsecaea erecta]OAP54691.1 hypothetical protein AYL99_11139 [Fonsecaea erecta]